MKKEKYQIDLHDFARHYETLLKELAVEQNQFKYAVVKDCFTKVAFDLYQSDVHPGLWQISEIEGEKYLVRLEPDAQQNLSKDGWIIAHDQALQNVTLAYKGAPIAKFSKKLYHFDKTSIDNFEKLVLRKITSDAEFRLMALGSIPKKLREHMEQKYPELRS